MAEPELSATAQLVRRYDPILFRTALFAAEPGRERLMTLYAFDIELSRALSRTAEPMIAAMRLQWWRDCLEEVRAGLAPRAHEVAGPLHALVRECPLPEDMLAGLVEAREREAEGLDDMAAFEAWADARFANLIRLALRCLGGGEDADGVAGPAGRALAAALAIRTAAPMAAGSGRSLLPVGGPDAAGELARGQTGDALRPFVRELAGQGQEALRQARRTPVPRSLHPALYPVTLAEPVLRRAMRRPDLAELAARPQEAGTGRLAVFAMLRRW